MGDCGWLALMFIANDERGQPIWATKTARAHCPACDDVVIAKCGDLMPWHWSHTSDRAAACDPWSESETQWHLDWKLQAQALGCQLEVTMKTPDAWHRADIVRPDGVVVEIQHSSIGQGQALERESFYRRAGGLIWLFDARERYWGQVERFGNGMAEWRMYSETIADLQAPMYWDTPDGLMSDLGTREGRAWSGGYLPLEVHDADPGEVFVPSESPVVTTFVAAAELPPADAWTVLPAACWTCGRKPDGTYRDGSPRFDCSHEPVRMAS